MVPDNNTDGGQMRKAWSQHILLQVLHMKHAFL